MSPVPTGTVLYDPADPALHADPYPTYARLRTEAPVLRGPLGIWIVSRYDDVTGVLRSPSFSSRLDAWSLFEDVATAIYGDVDCPVLALQQTWFMMDDGPSHMHARLRASRALNRCLGGAGHVDDDARHLVRELLDAGGGDFMRSVAVELPMRTICRLLDIPLDEGHALREQMDLVIRTFDLDEPDDDLIDAANRAVADLRDHFGALLRLRRRRPGEDLASHLLGASDDDELVTTLILLFAAGHETTVNLLGNGLLALAQHPDALRTLARDSTLVPGAVDEMLRFDSPMQVLARSAVEETNVGGRTVGPGERVVLLLGSANRDGDRFPDPDTFDIRRPDNRPVSFGAGPHLCIGAALARREAAAVVAAIASEARELTLIGPVERAPTTSHRGLSSLPIACVQT